MTFQETCGQCISDKALISEFNRLTGNHLGGPRSGIERMVDSACGFDQDKEAIPDFVRFVYEFKRSNTGFCKVCL